MSWHFSFSAKTREEAHFQVAKAVAENQPHCPEVVIPSADKLISLMPKEPSRPIVVLSYGHIDQNGGNALIEVKIAP
jgi:hypothetical protein